ncbi:MAG: MBL fold metallo-hydrolase [Candidatus Yanofskybacteria bacterium]|nr:MBL fold metallo-hydrolase [Candidatus Yanofskybacteria bacterium]
MPASLSLRKLSKLEWSVFIFITAAVVLSFVAVNAGAQSDGLLHVYFLDVGQGDAELIDFNGNQVLIDGGPDGRILQELGRIMPFYDQSIDLVILTHPHADHVAGLIEILKKYEVGQIIENYTSYNTADYAEWNKEKSSFITTQAEAGQIIDLGGGAKLTILSPPDPDADDASLRNSHDAMVVLRLDYGDDGILFMGDAEAKIEYKLLASGASLSAQFLKIGHHGSKTSTTEDFLKTVNPEVAFIEVGKKNKYGLPYQGILDRLKKYDIKYYRTDIDGVVELILDGQNYEIELDE